MGSDARSDHDNADGLRLRFPGSWWQVPLGDVDAALESARRLVVHAVGRADQHARLRADMRQRLGAAIDEARAANARRFAIALEIVPDIPIPAFLSIFDPGTDLATARSTDSADVMDVFMSGLARAKPATDESPAASGAAPVHRFAVGRSQVARRVRHRTIPADGDTPAVTNLIVEFWLTVPDRKRVVLLAFTSPAAELAEPLLNLFGGIVATAQWESSYATQ